MRRRVIQMLLTLLATALPMTAQATDTLTYRFTWEGSAGYALSGAMAVDQSRSVLGLVDARDVVCFEIAGTHNGDPIGRWALGQLMPDTPWRLYFDLRTDNFVVHGAGIRMPQAWNMDGDGTGCGPGGFGFNLGNFGQDLCKNDIYLSESWVDPQRPFPAEPARVNFSADACIAPPLIGLGSDPHAIHPVALTE